VEDDDPEKRIAELERGISGQGYPPPPPPPPMYGWENYAAQPPPVAARGPMVVKKSGLRLIPVLALGLGLVVPLIVGVTIWFTTASPFSKPQLHTADGLTEVMTTMRDQFGDTEGYKLVVYPEYASVDRVNPTNARAELNYTYRGDDWATWMPSTSVGSFDHVADLSRFDAAGVSATIATAPQQLGITDATATYLIIEGQDGGEVKLSVYVSAPATGWMEITPDGDVVKLHPPGGG
jgi:hypothetical protein